MKLGDVYGKLTVIGLSGRIKSRLMWLCKCECGKTKSIRKDSLISGYTTSCGCYLKKWISEVSFKHGYSRHKLYNIWKSMIHRCNSEINKSYKYYGGRGIKFCEEWEDFEVFREWSINNGYAEDLQLDRKNTNGNYEPGNCQWVTRKVNSNNKRNNVLVTAEGKTKTLSQWSEQTGIPYGTLQSRLKRGWNGSKLLTPVDIKYRNKSVQA